jgi:hypothetical protein
VRCAALDIVTLDLISVPVLQAKIPEVENIAIGMVLSIVRKVNMQVGSIP